ncbi:hypothetical protein ACVGOW_12420 [Pseudonocardia saturnea]
MGMDTATGDPADDRCVEHRGCAVFRRSVVPGHRSQMPMTSMAAWLLTFCGGALVVMGGYFLVARPPLLPEDARFMGSTAARILDAVPGLSTWLRRVFWVLGGYIATTGVLVVYVANTGVRNGSAGVLAVVAVAGITSLGWMSAVNFMLRSDYRWVLLVLDGVWALGLLLAVASGWR